jgi:hypothetical protein
LPHLGVHRTRVFALEVRRGHGSYWLRGQKLFGVLAKALEAAVAAEVVALAPVIDVTDRACWRDAHTADGIDHLTGNLSRIGGDRVVVVVAVRVGMGVCVSVT